MEKSEHIETLYQKYLSGLCTQKELDELLDAFLIEQDETELKKIITGHFSDELDEDDEHAITIANNVEAKLFTIVLQSIYKPKIAKNRSWTGIAAAAIIFITIAIGLIFYLNGSKQHQKIDIVYTSDVAPGKIGATLTLASGKKIRMADVSDGKIAEEAGIILTKAADGQLVYQIKAKVNQPGQVNILSTAKGETYSVTLPDKSKVWLNAASSLTYSATLLEHGFRKVKLEGEAYFQITKDKLHPFIVENRDQEVEVLGTHFNINSYLDEKVIKTTLLEGSVRVSLSSHSKIQNVSGLSVVLIPGQECVFNAGRMTARDVDSEEIIAWKDGKFSFNSETLQSIMRKVARWYDVEIKFQNEELMNRTFSGKVSRYENVSAVLRVLELTGGAKFKIEGRKITVL